MSYRGSESVSLDLLLTNPPEQEFEQHQAFLFRHIDFLIDVLTAEQYDKDWAQPAGCPTATPENQCRKRNQDDHFPCRYATLTTDEPSSGCDCGDSLIGSDDPLDTVAAVAIAGDDQTPAERYFDHEYRQIIATLRQNVGTWDEVASFDEQRLEEELARASNRDGVDTERVQRLATLLDKVADCSKTEGVSLRNLGGLPYSSFADLLSGFPGISQSDAWWLMLVAFDKPVWPSDPYIDGLLCSLGLLSVDKYQDDDARREKLEELTPRQIPALHRALAGHALKGGIGACGDSCEIRKFLLSYRLRKQAEPKDGPVVVDLFSGAGGLSLGFSRAGWDIELAIDNNQDASDTFRLNHPEIPHKRVLDADIRDVVEDDITERLERQPDVVVGGPPCQSLSVAGYRSRLSHDDEYSILEDDRTSLYNEYVDVIEKLRPKVFVMENVEGMVSEIDDADFTVGDLVTEALESIGGANNGYVCDYRLLNASEYGIPQERERVFILGLREDLVDASSDGTAEIDALFEELSSVGTNEEFDLQQALSGLPKLKRGEGGTVVPRSVRGSRSTYVTANGLEDGTNLCFNHQAREHPMEKDQILFDEALEPGDTGWDVKYAKDGDYAHLIEYDVGTEDNPRFKDKYRMLSWDEPAPTVVAHLAKDANNFVLPDYYEYANNVSGESDNERNRGITPREAARLQSFPDDFIFLGAFTSWFEQIGNAVPPVFGEKLATVIKRRLIGKEVLHIGERAESASQHASSDD